MYTVSSQVVARYSANTMATWIEHTDYCRRKAYPPSIPSIESFMHIPTRLNLVYLVSAQYIAWSFGNHGPLLQLGSPLQAPSHYSTSPWYSITTILARVWQSISPSRFFLRVFFILLYACLPLSQSVLFPTRWLCLSKYGCLSFVQISLTLTGLFFPFLWSY